MKDAASAAIYGAQSGAGGVVLVTTKKAKQGAPVSYTHLDVYKRQVLKLLLLLMVLLNFLATSYR